jgi:hypothetical protein
MRIVAEDLNDARKGLQSLKAIMMGPLLMAGGCVAGKAECFRVAAQWVRLGGRGGRQAGQYGLQALASIIHAPLRWYVALLPICCVCSLQG